MLDLLGTPSTNFIDKLKNVVFAFAVMFFWVHGVVYFLGYLNTPMDQFRQTPQIDFFFSCMCAPFFEEILFRWGPITLIKGHEDKFLWPVVLVGSIIFGLMHGLGPVSILLQGVMGFVFACVYLKNGSIVWSMLLHSAWNIYCFIYTN